MQAEGPVLETLTRRLAETPEDFLGEPRVGSSGRVHVAAVAGDLMRSLGLTIELAELTSLEGKDPRADRNRLAIGLFVCWLLYDCGFRPRQLTFSQFFF